jgi:hypothetical protein
MWSKLRFSIISRTTVSNGAATGAGSAGTVVVVAVVARFVFGRFDEEQALSPATLPSATAPARPRKRRRSRSRSSAPEISRRFR